MIKRFGALVFALTLLFSFAVPASAADGYTEYTSLSSSGIQYIDTQVSPDDSLRIVIDFVYDETLSGGHALFGSQADVSSRFGMTCQVISDDLTFLFGSNVSVDFTDSYDSGSVNTLDVDLPGGVITFNGESISFTPGAFSFSAPLYLFAWNTNGTASQFSNLTIYSCRIYDGTNLIRSFVPATDVNGSAGMYDLVNERFYSNMGTGSFSVGDIVRPDGPTVAETITDLNTQIHEIEQTIYDDLHTYSAQVDPSTATNFSGNFLSAMSFISNTWTSAYNQLGDMQVIITFPLFLAIAMLFIGRMNSVIASGAMKSRRNNDKKGGGDVG